MSKAIPLPYSDGSYIVTQGFNDASGSHNNYLKWGVDFGMPYGTDVKAMLSGEIVAFRQNVEEDFIEGPAGSSAGAGHGNYLTIRSVVEGQDVYITYAHMAPFFLRNSLGIEAGEGGNVSDEAVIASYGSVDFGEVIGTTGATGYRVTGRPESDGSGRGAHGHIHIGTNIIHFNTDNEDIADGSSDSTLPVYFEAFGRDDSDVPISPMVGETYLGSSYSLFSDANGSDSVTPTEPVPPAPSSTMTSFADAAVDFGVQDGSDVAKQYLQSIFGSAVSNVKYKGSEDAAFLVKNFEVPGVDIDLEGGILLSSGGFPGSSNTLGDFTVQHGTEGDSDLFDVVSTAFPGAGQTQDASVLEFDIFVDDQDVDGVRFDIVFGSDEYSEYSNSSYVDVAAVWVDDDRDGDFENEENKALFNGDSSTPLSILDENIALNFIDNENGDYAIEWDGFGALAARPTLQQGWNSIKIAVADTGDQVFDSGIYVTNFELLTGGATGSNVFKVVNGKAGKNDLEALETKQEFNFTEGAGSVYGTLSGLNGDVVTGFDNFKSLVFQDIYFPREQLNVLFGSAILEIDSDKDGISNSTVTLEGNFTDGDFMAVTSGGNTTVTFETFLPTLKEGKAVDPGLVNGINNQAFLTGDGSSDFSVTLRDMGHAGYNNVVGVYEVDAGGNIVDTRILFENANADKAANATITGVESGNQLGFFIVQDAASWAETLNEDDVLSFVNGSGAAATVADGSGTSIAVNGSAIDQMVFHSLAQDMNSDGVQHALSGVEVGGEAITVGFEDLTGGGDIDYEDVVFQVEYIDTGAIA